MAFVDLLLHIDSCPTPTTPAAVDEAVALAASLGGRLTGLAVEVAIPLDSHRLAARLIGLSDMASTLAADSREACRVGLAHFANRAKGAGVFEASVLAQACLFGVGDLVAKMARTRNLCLLPLVGDFNSQIEIARSVVFSSGRPMLMFRAGEAAGLLSGPERVVVAWDGSRCAARALADAAPLLQRANHVVLLTILNEKADTPASLGEEARRHLQTHGVAATVEQIDADGHAIGPILDQYLNAHRPDLLVMGAYGHSRAQEFLLGGATEHVLGNPACPVFLSH